MMLLAVTTATPRFGAALLEDGEILARVDHEEEMRHAETLFAALDGLFADAGRSRRALTAIACDVGPGSFTGVRVGLSSCKGIALGLGVPLIPVTSLAAMTAAAFELAPDEAQRIVAVLDAKRGEIFFGGHRRDGEPGYPAGFAPAPRAGEALAEAIADPACWFCGRAAADLVPDARRVTDAASDLPDAGWIARLAAARSRAGAPVDLAQVEPVYLREPDAKKPTGLPKLFTKA